MVSSSSLEHLAQRFAPYIDELHDLFSARKVPFGSPADLSAFPQRLADPAFADEMVSMVRSVFYRENGVVPVRELTEMVAIAVAGLHLETTSSESQAPMEQLRSFVTAVTRPPRATFPAEIPELTAASAQDEAPNVSVQSEPRIVLSEPEQPASSPEPTVTRFTASAPAPLAVTREGSAPPGAVPLAQTETETLPTNDRLSRALAHNDTPGPQPSVHQSPQSTEQPQFPFTPARPLPRAPRQSVGTFFRNAYWIPGLCFLLLALGAVFFVRSRPVPHAPQIPVQAAVLPTTTLPKPSAYGATLREAAPALEHTDPVPTHAAALPSDTAPASPEPGPGTSLSAPATAPARRSTPHLVTPTKPATVLLPSMREGVFLASSGMMAAHLLSAPAPSYPKLASFARVEGEVIVQVVVSRDGTVEATRVLQGPRLLRGAAEHAIRRWRYRPYFVDGKTTDVATIVTVNFQLRH